MVLPKFDPAFSQSRVQNAIPNSVFRRPAWRDPTPPAQRHCSDDDTSADSESELITFEDEAVARTSIYLDEAKKLQASGWHDAANDDISSEEDVYQPKLKYRPTIQPRRAERRESLGQTQGPKPTKRNSILPRDGGAEMNWRDVERCFDEYMPVENDKVEVRPAKAQRVRNYHGGGGDAGFVSKTDSKPRVDSKLTGTVTGAVIENAEASEKVNEVLEMEINNCSYMELDPGKFVASLQMTGHPLLDRIDFKSKRVLVRKSTGNHVLSPTHYALTPRLSPRSSRRQTLRAKYKPRFVSEVILVELTDELYNALSQAKRDIRAARKMAGRKEPEEVDALRKGHVGTKKGHSPQVNAHPNLANCSSPPDKNKVSSTYGESQGQSLHDKGYPTHQKSKRQSPNMELQANFCRPQDSSPSVTDASTTHVEEQAKAVMSVGELTHVPFQNATKSTKARRTPVISKIPQRTSNKRVYQGSPVGKTSKVLYGPPQLPKYIVRKSRPPRPLTRGYGFTNVTRTYWNPTTKNVFTTKDNISSQMLERILTAQKTTRVSLSDVEEVLASASPRRVKKSTVVKPTETQPKSRVLNASVIPPVLIPTRSPQKAKGYQTHRAHGHPRMSQVAESTRMLKSSGHGNGFKPNTLADVDDYIQEPICLQNQTKVEYMEVPADKRSDHLNSAGDCQVDRNLTSQLDNLKRVDKLTMDKQSDPLRIETGALRTQSVESWETHNNLSKCPLPSNSPSPTNQGSSVRTVQSLPPVKKCLEAKIVVPVKSKSDELTSSARSRKKLETTKCGRRGYYGGGCLKVIYQPPKPLVPPKHTVHVKKTPTPPKVPRKSTAGKIRYLEAEIVKSDHHAYLQRIRNARPSQAIASAFGRRPPARIK